MGGWGCLPPSHLLLILPASPHPSLSSLRRCRVWFCRPTLSKIVTLLWRVRHRGFVFGSSGVVSLSSAGLESWLYRSIGSRLLWSPVFGGNKGLGYGFEGFALFFTGWFPQSGKVSDLGFPQIRRVWWSLAPLGDGGHTTSPEDSRRVFWTAVLGH